MNAPAAPIIDVLSADPTVAERVAHAHPGHAEIRTFQSPLDAIGACLNRPPLFLAVHVAYEQQTWLTALEALHERPDAPRILYLVEPAMIDEVMSGLFRNDTDHMVLWPADTAQLCAAVHRMLTPPRPEHPPLFTQRPSLPL